MRRCLLPAKDAHLPIHNILSQSQSPVRRSLFIMVDSPHRFPTCGLVRLSHILLVPRAAKLIIHCIVDHMRIYLGWMASIWPAGNSVLGWSLNEGIQALLRHWSEIHTSMGRCLKKIKFVAVNPLLTQGNIVLNRTEAVSKSKK
jgi:hypothetical protein